MKDDDNDLESDLEQKRLQRMTESKKKYLKSLVSKNMKMAKNEEKMEQLVQIAESLVNYLLTRKEVEKKQQSKSKSHIE